MQTSRHAITNTPSIIFDPPECCAGATLIVSNLGDDSVFIDGPEVTTEAGFELQKEQLVTIVIPPGEAVYAMTAYDKESTVCVLVTGR